MLLFQTPAYIESNKPHYVPYSTDIMDYFKSYGNFIYSFNCIVNVFIVKSSLNKLTKRRLSKTFRNTIYFLFLFYAFISITGYLSLGQEALDYDLIVLRDPLPNSSDIWMRIALCAICFQVLIGFIIHVIPIKTQVIGYFALDDNSQNNTLLSIFLTYSPTIVAWLYPYAKKLFSILGAFFGTAIIVSFPGMMMLKYFSNTGKGDTLKYKLILLWCVGLTLVGFVSGSVLIVNEFVG